MTNGTALVQQERLPSGAEIRRDPESGAILSLKSDDLTGVLGADPVFRDAIGRKDFGPAAVRLLAAYRLHFRLTDPPSELKVREVGAPDSLGYVRVRLDQVYQDIEVWGASILVNFDASGRPRVIQGRYIPTPSASPVKGALTPETLCSRITAKPEFAGASCRLEGGPVLFPTESGEVRFGYRFHLEGLGTARWELIVDAGDGAILNRINLTQTGFPVFGDP